MLGRHDITTCSNGCRYILVMSQRLLLVQRKVDTMPTNGSRNTRLATACLAISLGFMPSTEKFRLEKLVNKLICMPFIFS